MLLAFLIKVWLLKLILGFLHVVHDVLVCTLIVGRMLRVRCPLVVNADLCIVESTQLALGNFSFLFVRSPLHYLVVLCRVETFLILLAELRRNFASLAAAHRRIVACRLLHWDA